MCLGVGRSLGPSSSSSRAWTKRSLEGTTLQVVRHVVNHIRRSYTSIVLHWQWDGWCARDMRAAPLCRENRECIFAHCRSRNPHLTEIIRKRSSNILWKYFNSLRQYMSEYNMRYAIFSKYCKNLQMHGQCFFSNELNRTLSLNFQMSIMKLKIVFYYE